jgi:hypothetical protein
VFERRRHPDWPFACEASAPAVGGGASGPPVGRAAAPRTRVRCLLFVEHLFKFKEDETQLAPCSPPGSKPGALYWG